jgi:hypothetical protein
LKYKKNNLQKDKNILILISSSSGEIDWILPICRYIKINYPNIKLYLLFDAIFSDEIMKGNEFLYDLLCKNVHYCYDFGDFLPPYIKSLLKPIMKYKTMGDNVDKKEKFIQRFETYLYTFIKLTVYKKIMEYIKPDILLKDISPDIYSVRKHIVTLAKKTGCNQVMFPHATELHWFSPLKPRKNCFADDILITSKWMNGLSSEFKGYKNKTHIVGNPRYDDWWIEYLLYFYNNYNDRKEYTKLNKTIFLFFTQYPFSKTTFSYKVGLEIINEVLSTIFSNENSFLIVKPHPREIPNYSKKELEKYDENRWTIDKSHPIILSDVADIIICMGYSSVILDSLSLEKPVIEYYKYSDIKYVDLYGKLGVVLSANNVKLESLINQIKKDPDRIKKPYIKNFRKIVPKTKNESTKKAVNVILNILKERMQE